MMHTSQMSLSGSEQVKVLTVCRTGSVSHSLITKSTVVRSTVWGRPLSCYKLCLPVAVQVVVLDVSIPLAQSGSGRQ